MLCFVTGFGPEIPREALTVVEELESVVQDFDAFIKRRKGAANIVISFIAINPARGAIPNSTILKRLSRELWSTWNISYDDFLQSDNHRRREILKAGAADAIRALSGKYLLEDDANRLAEALASV